jgi:flagellar protein FlaJ
MKKKTTVILPFSFLPLPLLQRLASHFKGWGAILVSFFPHLEAELDQAGLKFDREEYGAFMVVLWIFYFFIFTFLVFVFMSEFLGEREAIFFSPLVGFFLAFMIALQLAFYPKMMVRKKVRAIERNLVFALRTMLVQLRSNVSLFNALDMVAEGEYGEVSSEFKKAIKRINAGELEQDVLEEVATNNPSYFFRKALWQIATGLKAGADVNEVLKETVNSLTGEQRLRAVIVPALGVTFLIVLSAFPQISINELMFWLLLLVVTVGEFMYMGLMKSRRPNLMEAEN